MTPSIRRLAIAVSLAVLISPALAAPDRSFVVQTQHAARQAIAAMGVERAAVWSWLLAIACAWILFALAVWKTIPARTSGESAVPYRSCMRCLAGSGLAGSALGLLLGILTPPATLHAFAGNSTLVEFAPLLAGLAWQLLLCAGLGVFLYAAGEEQRASNELRGRAKLF